MIACFLDRLPIGMKVVHGKHIRDLEQKKFAVKSKTYAEPLMGAGYGAGVEGMASKEDKKMAGQWPAIVANRIAAKIIIQRL